jgi:hypothetical protein
MIFILFSVCWNAFVFLVKDTYCKYTNFAFICTLFTGLRTMKKIFVIIAGILLNTSLFGQTVTEQEKAVYDPQNTLTDRPLSKPDQRPPLRERLFFGGYFGLQFGDYTNIEVSPTIGVWVLPRVAIAAGPSFQYYATPYIETTIYGGTSYVQLMLLRDLNNILPVGIHLGIYGQAEYEGQSLDNSYVYKRLTGFGRQDVLGCISSRCGHIPASGRQGIHKP